MSDTPPPTPTPPPFYLAYLSPDLVDFCDPCIAHPPTLARGPDGAVLVYFRGDQGVHATPEGRVRAVHRAGAVAVIELDHVRDEADPTLAALLIVRADALPPAPCPAAVALAGDLRGRYGDTLTVRQVAAAGVVSGGAVYQALRRGRLEGARAAGRWHFTPEQAAAWLVGRG